MKKIYEVFGVEKKPVSHTEKLVSAMGGFVAIMCIFIVSQWFVDFYAAAMIVSSMGASAVLLFAVPHGPLSQPWPVFGGHIISALIGVSCTQVFSNEIFSASFAVGASIAVMYYLRCIHPPGGATALAAVIGGEAVYELGYLYVITPILMNVIIILMIGVIFNYLFPWRRYPTVLHRKKIPKNISVSKDYSSQISHEDFVSALREINSFVDIDEHDLLDIYNIAIKKSQESLLTHEKLIMGGFYSNGQYGEQWSVRQIVDESVSEDQSKDMIVYKVVAGLGRRSSGYSTRAEFMLWAKHQVERDEDNWKRRVDLKEK